MLMVPLETAFGWSRTQISLAVSVNVLLYGFTAPFAAALMERFGIRRVVMAALREMRTDRTATELLVATDDGRALYATLGWTVISPFVTAEIPPA